MASLPFKWKCGRREEKKEENEENVADVKLQSKYVTSNGTCNGLVWSDCPHGRVVFLPYFTIS